jgi:hypothetical protein
VRAAVSIGPSERRARSDAPYHHSEFVCHNTGTAQRTAFAGVLGFGLSLVIETAQYFIPARFPGTTDLLLNTLGACLGGLVAAGLVALVAGRHEAVRVPRTRPA